MYKKSDYLIRDIMHYSEIFGIWDKSIIEYINDDPIFLEELAKKEGHIFFYSGSIYKDILYKNLIPFSNDIIDRNYTDFYKIGLLHNSTIYHPIVELHTGIRTFIKIENDEVKRYKFN